MFICYFPPNCQISEGRDLALRIPVTLNKRKFNLVIIYRGLNLHRPRHVGSETHCLCEQLTLITNIIIMKIEYMCMMFSILAARKCKGSLSGTVMDIPEMVITVIFPMIFFLIIPDNCLLKETVSKNQSNTST